METSSQWVGLEEEVIVKWAGLEGKRCRGVAESRVGLGESGDSGFTEIRSVCWEPSVTCLLNTQGISISFTHTHTHLQCNNKISSQSPDYLCRVIMKRAIIKHELLVCVCVCLPYILRQLRVSVRAFTLFSMLSIF